MGVGGNRSALAGAINGWAKWDGGRHGGIHWKSVNGVESGNDAVDPFHVRPPPVESARCG